MRRDAHKTTSLYNIASAILAFGLWGGWAFYINSGSGFATQITSGLIQGTASLVITLVMVQLVTIIFNRLSQGVMQVPLSALSTVSLTGSLLLLIHYLAGTPNIISTIAPPLSVAFLFCIFTAFKLTRSNVRKLPSDAS